MSEAKQSPIPEGPPPRLEVHDGTAWREWSAIDMPSDQLEAQKLLEQLIQTEREGIIGGHLLYPNGTKIEGSHRGVPLRDLPKLPYKTRTLSLAEGHRVSFQAPLAPCQSVGDMYSLPGRLTITRVMLPYLEDRHITSFELLHSVGQVQALFNDPTRLKRNVIDGIARLQAHQFQLKPGERAAEIEEIVLKAQQRLLQVSLQVPVWSDDGYDAVAQQAEATSPYPSLTIGAAMSQRLYECENWLDKLRTLMRAFSEVPREVEAQLLDTIVPELFLFPDIIRLAVGQFDTRASAIKGLLRYVSDVDPVAPIDEHREPDHLIDRLNKLIQGGRLPNTKYAIYEVIVETLTKQGRLSYEFHHVDDPDARPPTNEESATVSGQITMLSDLHEQLDLHIKARTTRTSTYKRDMRTALKRHVGRLFEGQLFRREVSSHFDIIKRMNHILNVAEKVLPFAGEVEVGYEFKQERNQKVPEVKQMTLSHAIGEHLLACVSYNNADGRKNIKKELMRSVDDQTNTYGSEQIKDKVSHSINTVSTALKGMTHIQDRIRRLGLADYEEDIRAEEEQKALDKDDPSVVINQMQAAHRRQRDLNNLPQASDGRLRDTFVPSYAIKAVTEVFDEVSTEVIRKSEVFTLLDQKYEKNGYDKANSVRDMIKTGVFPKGRSLDLARVYILNSVRAHKDEIPLQKVVFLLYLQMEGILAPEKNLVACDIIFETVQKHPDIAKKVLTRVEFSETQKTLLNHSIQVGQERFEAGKSEAPGLAKTLKALEGSPDDDFAPDDEDVITPESLGVD